jgi:hypothetical protein
VGASGGERTPGEPGCEAVEVERRRSGHVLQARFGQPTVARPAQAEGAHTLRDRALNALTPNVEPPTHLAGLSRPGGRDRLVLGTGVQREPAADRPGAARPHQARPAIGRAEAYSDVGPACGFVPVLAPARALMALGAAHAMLVPIHREVGGTERTLILHLPALVGPRRADELDPVLLTGTHEVFGADVARVDEVLGRG